jgi:hypothetical protein
MPNNDPANLDQLLELLRRNPDLIRELVFNPERIPDVVRATTGLSPPTQAFLLYLSGPQDGYAIAPCLNNTNVLCAKGTEHLACLSGTRPPP